MQSQYDMELACVTQQLTQEEFERGYFVREKSVGALRDDRFFTALFAVLGLLFLAVKIPELAQFHWESAIVGLVELLLCLACVVYQQLVLPQQVLSEASLRYRTNRTLQCRETIRITRDGYAIETPYEQISGYWSETAHCVESPSWFVFAGSLGRGTILLPKANLTPEETQRISEKMQEVFGSRFRRAGRD